MSEIRQVLRLVVALLVWASMPAYADNSLQGLEMDVMEPGESAAHATSRIALPPPAPEQEAGLDPEQRVRVGGVGEAATDSLGVAGNPALAPDIEQPTTALPGDAPPGDDTTVVSPDPGTITTDTGGN